MGLGLILTYSDVFSGKVPEVSMHLKKIPSRIALEYLSHACGYLHLDPGKISNQKHLLNILIRRLHPEFRKVIYKSLGWEKGSTKIVFDIHTVMQLINHVVENWNDVIAPDSTARNESDLFMSVLIVNETRNKKHNLKGDTLEKYCRAAWPLLIEGTELRIRKHALLEFARSINFFNYASHDPDISAALTVWQGKSKFAEAAKYPNEILGFYLNNGLDKEHPRFRNKFTNEPGNLFPVLKNWVIDVQNISQGQYRSQDYTTLRSKPILKISNSQYLVSNWNFILDKFYNGLLFDLHQNTDLKIKYRSFQGFKGVIGKTFGEPFARELIEFAAKKRNYEIHQGDDNAQNNQDIIIQNGRHICVFEIKDALFVKHGTYEEIKGELDKKIVQDTGVKQLIETIGKLQQNPKTFGITINSRQKMIVYPVLVVSDTSFALTGMEDYANNFFRKNKAIHSKNLFSHRLVILDLEALFSILGQVQIGKQGLFTILNNYYRAKFRAKKIGRKRWIVNRSGHISQSQVNEKINQHKGFKELVQFNDPFRRLSANPETVIGRVIASMRTLEEWPAQELTQENIEKP